MDKLENKETDNKEIYDKIMAYITQKQAIIIIQTLL